MSNVERLELELARARLVEEYEALRPQVEDPATNTPELVAEYRRLNDLISAANTNIKTLYPPVAAEGAPAPAPVAAHASSSTASESEGSDDE